MLVIPLEAGRAVAAFGSVAVFQLEGSHTAGNLCLALAETPPGVGPPPHVHHRDDELFLVLQGELSKFPIDYRRWPGSTDTSSRPARIPTAKHQPLMEPGCLDLRTHCQAHLQEDL